MAENKEITTLHPYMNRNKNRYPNVKDENIPDTIQRKMTAGTGISITPDNVISATGGDSYTRSETDALLDTKADKVALENVNKVVPTDIAVKDGKLGLKHDTAWLTNQNAITLGTHLTYDAGTNTLDAVSEGGATLPAGTKSDPFIINKSKAFAYDTGRLQLDSVHAVLMNGSEKDFTLVYTNNNKDLSLSITRPFGSSINYKLEYYGPDPIRAIVHISNPDEAGAIVNKRSGFVSLKVPTDKTETYYLEGTYDATSRDSAIKWSALKKTFNHYIVITDGTASNAIYLLIPSTNNLICNILTDLDTLLGTEPRFIQASGVVTDTASKLPIVAIKWQGSFSSSKIVTISSEEATTKFTDIVDVVEPA